MAKFATREGKGKSPYSKYKKRAHQYSELFGRWSAARLAGNTAEARRLGLEHTERYGGPECMENIRKMERYARQREMYENAADDDYDD